MDASAIIAFCAFSSTIAGYALKKSWMLWMAIPLFFILFFYWSYNETWFVASAQHSLIYLSIGTTIALAFTAIRMQAKPASEAHGDDNMEDVECNADKSYYAERDRYNNNQNRHKRSK